MKSTSHIILGFIRLLMMLIFILISPFIFIYEYFSHISEINKDMDSEEVHNLLLMAAESVLMVFVAIYLLPFCYAKYVRNVVIEMWQMKGGE